MKSFEKLETQIVIQEHNSVGSESTFSNLESIEFEWQKFINVFLSSLHVVTYCFIFYITHDVNSSVLLDFCVQVQVPQLYIIESLSDQNIIMCSYVPYKSGIHRTLGKQEWTPLGKHAKKKICSHYLISNNKTSFYM